MAGTITPHMWVWVVENKAFGNRAFCRQVESFQQFGDYSPQALSALVKLARRVGTRAARRGAQDGRCSFEAAHHARPPDGRRDAQQGGCLLQHLHKCRGARAGGVRAAGGAGGGDLALRGESPLPFPRAVHGSREVGRRPCARRRGEQHGDRHGKERHRVRHPGERTGRRMVHGPRAARERLVPPGVEGRGCGRRHGGLGNH